MTKKFRTHVGWGRERVFEVINIRNESGEKPNGKKVTATLDAEAAYSDADFVVIAALTNVYSTNRSNVA